MGTATGLREEWTDTRAPGWLVLFMLHRGGIPDMRRVALRASHRPRCGSRPLSKVRQYVADVLCVVECGVRWKGRMLVPIGCGCCLCMYSVGRLCTPYGVRGTRTTAMHGCMCLSSLRLYFPLQIGVELAFSPFREGSNPPPTPVVKGLSEDVYSMPDRGYRRYGIYRWPYGEESVGRLVPFSPVARAMASIRLG